MDGNDIRVQDEQGNIHVFPAEATPQMIAQAMNVKPPSAAPSSGNPNLDRFRSEGIGDRLTDVSGALASAKEAGKGVLKGAGTTVANIVQMAGQTGYVPGAPISAIDELKSRMQPTNTEQKVGYYGEGAAEVAAPMLKGAGAAADALPSAERAGAAFKDVMSAAKDVPVDLQNSQDAILKMVDWQKKTQLGPTVNKFLNRVTNPKLGDLTYGEARDFYQLLGRMSADETMKIAPAIRYDLTRMVAGLKQDVGNAAETVGKGQQYFDAMKEFASAKRLEDVSDATKQIIIEALKRAALPMAGAGFGLYAGKKIYDATR